HVHADTAEAVVVAVVPTAGAGAAAARHQSGGAGEERVLALRALLLERHEVVLVGLELLVAEGVDRLAVLLLLVDAAVSIASPVRQGSLSWGMKQAPGVQLTGPGCPSGRRPCRTGRTRTGAPACACARACRAESQRHCSVSAFDPPREETAAGRSK